MSYVAIIGWVLSISGWVVAIVLFFSGGVVLDKYIDLEHDHKKLKEDQAKLIAASTAVIRWWDGTERKSVASPTYEQLRNALKPRSNNGDSDVEM